MSSNEDAVAVPRLEEVIGKVESLYRIVTGSNPPPAEGGHLPIPVEKDPGEHVQEQLDRLLSLLGEGFPGGSVAPPWNPPMTIFETASEIVVRVDLPGVSRQELELFVSGDQLTIRGERSDRRGAAGEELLRLRETPLGPFARRIVLPPTLRTAEPQANLKDGVLEVRLARRSPEELAPKNVPVQ